MSINLCMISGSFEYDSEASLSKYVEYLAREAPDIAPTLIIYQDEDDNQSLAALDDADVALVFTRRIRIDGDELGRFKRYCLDWRPVVGVRTASHAYQNWLDFDKLVLGGSYDGHYGGGPLCRVDVAGGASDHPILEGVTSFESQGSLYKNASNASDTTTLLNGATDEATEPVAWTRVQNGGRVFYTSLGHQADFDEPDFLQLLRNGVRWAADPHGILNRR